MKSSLVAAILVLSIMSAPSYAIDETDDSDFIYARKAFNDKFYDLAGQRLEAYLNTYPKAQHLYEAQTLLGRCYYHLNNPIRALYAFEVVLGSPQASLFHDSALYWQAETYAGGGDHKKALELYQKLIDEYPTSKYISFTVFSKGFAYYKLGLLKDALSDFREVVSKYPQDQAAVEAQFRIGECEYLLGNYVKSEEELGSFIEKYPLSELTAEAHYLKGESLFYQERYREAVPLFDKSLTIAGKSKWERFAVYRKASALFQIKDYEASAREYKKLANDRTDAFLAPSSIMGLAKCYESMGNMAAAIKEYGSIIELFPVSESAVEAFYRKVRLLEGENRHGEAKEICLEGLRRFPVSDYADRMHFELGWIYSALGMNEEAIAEFVWVETESKDINLSAGSLCRIGDIYFDKKEYSRATESYDIALDKYPDSYWADYAQYQIGNTFLAVNKYDQAVLAYQSALVNFPGTRLKGKILFQLATAYYKWGDFEHASSEFRRVISEYPEEEMIWQARSYLADSLYWLGKYQDALSLYEGLIKDSPDEELRTGSEYRAAWSLYNMKRESEAVARFEAFLRVHPGSSMVPDVLFWFGEYYRSKADFDRAVEYFSELLTKHPSEPISEEALLMIALSLSEKGDTGQAIEKLEELVRVTQDADRRRTAYRKIAKLMTDKRDIDSAIEYFKKALTNENNELNAQIQYEVAESCESKGDLEKAAEEYLKVSYLYSKGTFWAIRAQLKCAQVFERIGKAEEAKRLYHKLGEMDIEESKFANQRLEWLKWRGEE